MEEMMTYHSEWFFYLFGAILTLVWKWFRWVYTGWNQKKNWKQSTKEWLNITLLEEKVSWITTIAIVWVFGACYIGRVSFIWTGWLESIPIENSIAFLFGSMMEWIAPAVFKWIINKMPIQ